MNKYYRKFKKLKNDRDFVFKDVLKLFNKQPIKILEIGTIRNVDVEEGKSGDGYSTLFWCEYIKKHGGRLTICDTSILSIVNCKRVIDDFIDQIDIEFITGDGNDYLNKDYDLIYLDGSDDPNVTFEQFKKISRTKTYILCDDFHTKGQILRNFYRDFEVFKCNETHEMALYKPNSNQNIQTPNQFINYIHETNAFFCSTRNSENIFIGTVFSDNRNMQVLEYQQKVFNKFQIPINYLKYDSKQLNHGQALETIIVNTINRNVHYYVFMDMDCIPLLSNFVDIVYDKIKDKNTLFGGLSQSNHKRGPNGEFNHPYISAANMAFSKELYLKCNSPTFSDHIPRSDTGEEFTYKCEELGFQICQVWPSSVVGFTLEECKELEIDPKHQKSALGNGMWMGFGTTYSNLFYHQMAAGCKRHIPMFIQKCEEILNK